MSAASESPEIGETIVADGIATNVHIQRAPAGPIESNTVLLLHGSGPGVSAFANWRLTLPLLAENFTVVAPDVVGFGFTERPADITYDRC